MQTESNAIPYDPSNNDSPTTPTPAPLRMGTLRESRQTLAKILREYRNIDEPSIRKTDQTRTLIYGLSVMVQYHKTELEVEALARIEALEQAALQLQNSGQIRAEYLEFALPTDGKAVGAESEITEETDSHDIFSD